MSGPFGSSQWMYNAGGSFYGYEIDNSLRGNEADSPYLNRTPSSASNRKTYTISAWVKPALEVATFSILGAGSSGSAYYIFGIEGDDLYFEETSGGGALRANRKLRDPSAWYHLMAAVDSTQATAANRIKLYVNGIQETSFSSETYMSQNRESSYINNTSVHYIGHSPAQGSHYLNGYIAEVNFIDGQSLDPTSFGEVKSDIWIPKDTAGLTFGTNGFRLQFGDSAAIGDDTSGNTNDFTANNLVASDVVLDSPTNNWCILEANQNRATYSLPTLSEGNLKFGSAGISTSWGYRASNMEFSSGKWYAECRVSGNTYAMVGVFNTGFYGESHFLDQNPQNNTGGWLIYHDAATTTNSKFDGTTASATITDFNENDIVGLELDADNGTVKFYVNGTLQTGLGSSGTVDISEGTGDAFRFWSLTPNGGGITFIWNFGQDSTFAGATTAGGNADGNGLGDFKHSPSSGYLAPCSANLTTAIDNAEDESAQDYFNTILFDTQSGSYPKSSTGVGFQPDWVWGKSRNQGYNHYVFDVVRGTGDKALQPSSNSGEGGGTTLTSFNSDGFTLGAGDALGYTNGVYWNWKAGGTAVSNTDGSITSQVSANVDAGFSIVSYTGTGSAATVGHGLTQAPDWYVVKNRDTTGNWVVYHKDLKASGFTAGQSFNYLNDTLGVTDSTVWNNTNPSSSVFNIGTSSQVNGSGNDLIAYCFHNVEGYSKFGSYVGNGSSDGTFIHTGFRPAFVIVKRISTSGGEWVMWDNKRSGYNVDNDFLYANTTATEFNGSTYVRLDLTSNGFKMRDNSADTNGSGATYIYLAFAEQPFKYANAR